MIDEIKSKIGSILQRMTDIHELLPIGILWFSISVILSTIKINISPGDLMVLFFLMCGVCIVGFTLLLGISSFSSPLQSPNGSADK